MTMTLQIYFTQFLTVSTLVTNVFGFSTNMRIIGGEEVTSPSQYPYLVSITWGGGDLYRQVCGGTILTPNWILSAGHCFTNYPYGDFRVQAGITNLEDTKNGQIRDVIETILHPKFHGRNTPNNIALMRLSEPLEWNINVQPINLPKDGEEPSLGKANFAGWGETSGTPWPDQLSKTELDVISLNDCKTALVNIFNTSEPLVETNICTGPLDGSTAVCILDTGGPLVQENVVIGVSSWIVTPCGTPAPSVFTKVSSYIDFITQNIPELA